MRLNALCFLLAAAAPLVALAASAEGKQVIISYPEDTPLSVLEEAKNAIIKAGGAITHEFTLIKGFAADATAEILETLSALESHSNVLIEEDKVVKINNA